MRQARCTILLLAAGLFWGCQGSTPTANLTPQPAAIQPSPVFASVADLSRYPLKFDGQLVIVRAWLVMGWEGDNFLFDASAPPNRNMPSRVTPSIWLYCKPEHEEQVYGAISRQRVLGTFTGYFHFVPDQKSRIQSVFDPGPLQLEGIRVTQLDSEDR